MRIDAGTADAMDALSWERLDAVSTMLGLPAALAPGAFVTLDSGLFGTKGEVLTPEGHVSFKCDKGLKKTKKAVTTLYREVTSIEFDGTGPFFRWTFRGAGGGFDLELSNYEGRNGLGARQIFWYDIEDYPVRSGLFYRAAGQVVSRSAARSHFDHPSPVSRRIEEAVSSFEAGPGLVSESLSQPDPYFLWAGVFDGFCSFLAGSTMACDSDASGWVDLFMSLDGFYARILTRFLKEIDERSGPSLSRESSILALSDQFDRLSALWYARRIARLHFAEGRVDSQRIREWNPSLLTPRALQAGGRISIRLRERSMYEEEIRLLGS
ncbi:MAG: hypothetical protein QUS11_02910 [Candidatus Fermentibacter sp.]|nr:hypothetical protein [Candidatus Fermentibacter sp.]